MTAGVPSTILLFSWLCWSLMMYEAVGDDYDITWCWPKLWEGKSWTLQITHTDQGPDVWERTSEMSLDVIGQRMALRETGVRHGQPHETFYLYYYPARTLYTVENGACTSTEIDGQVLGCKVLPGNHITEFMVKTILGGYSFGHPDNPGEIPIFAVGVEDPVSGIGEFYVAEPEGFYPVMDEVRGDVNGEVMYQVTYFYNATLGIKDPGVFTPPDICLKQ